MIICITGFPGCGKSTVAELLKQELEQKGRTVRHYTTDWMRFKLFPELVENAAELGRDFTTDELERSYNGLFMLFEELIETDPALVIITDGTYRKESQRNSLREIARRHKVPFVLIRVTAGEDAIITRLDERLAKGAGSGPESYRVARAVYEEPSNAHSIDNTGDRTALQKGVKLIVQDITGAA